MGCITSYMAVTSATTSSIAHSRQKASRHRSVTNATVTTGNGRSNGHIATTASTPVSTPSTKSLALLLSSANSTEKSKTNHRTAVNSTQNKSCVFTIAKTAVALQANRYDPTQTLDSLLQPTTTLSSSAIKSQPPQCTNSTLGLPTTKLPKALPSNLPNSSFKKVINNRKVNQWNAAQASSFSLTTTSLSSASATTSTFSRASTSNSSTQTEEILGRLLELEDKPQSERPNSPAITIDQLLGTRMDSAKLLKIMEQKTHNTINNVQPEVKVNSTNISVRSKRSVIDTENFKSKATNKTKPVKQKTNAKSSIKPSKIKQESKDSKSSILSKTSWEFDKNSVPKTSVLKKQALQSLKETTPQTAIIAQFQAHLEKQSAPTELQTRNYHLYQSQNSLKTHFTTTSYPLSSDDLNSFPSVPSSVASNTINNLLTVKHEKMTSDQSHKQTFDRETLQMHRIQAFRQLPNNYPQTNSMLNRLDTLSTASSVSTVSGATIIQTDATNTTFSQHKTALAKQVEPETKTKQLCKPLSKQTNNNEMAAVSILRRHHSEDNYAHKTEPLTLHRPSIADRRRQLRHALTMPNLNYNNSNSFLSETKPNESRSELRQSRQMSRSFTNVSTMVSRNSQINSSVTSVITSATEKFPTSTHLPVPRLTTATTSMSQSKLTIPVDPSNAYQSSKSPSLTMSQTSNRFESLLRHRSFLKTAVSSVSSNFGTRPPEAAELDSESSQQVLQIIKDHGSGVNCLELSEDQSLLVSGGEDGTLRLWSTFSLPVECIGVLVGHTDYITCCTVYRLMVVSGSADRTIKLWSIEDGNCLMTLTGHTAFINRVVCYGPLLLSSSFDGTVRIWTLTDRLTIIQHMKTEGSLELESFTRQSSTETESDEKLDYFKQKTLTKNLVQRQTVTTTFGGCFHTLQGHEKSVSQVAVMATDQTQLESGIIQELDIVVSTSADGTARTWALSTGELRHILTGHSGAINCLALDPKEVNLVYTAGADWTIKCWDVVTGEHLRDLKGHQSPIFCLLSHNRILYSGSADNTVRAWAMEFGQCTRIYYRNTGSVTCIQYLNGIVYTGSNDHSARLYDSNSGVLKQTLIGHENSISAMKVVSGKLFTSSFDGRIIVWDCTKIQRDIEVNGMASKDDTREEQSRSNSKEVVSSRHMSRQTSQTQTGTFIGPTLLNHTLELFAGNNRKHSRDSLYPELTKDDRTETVQNRLVAEAIQQAVIGRRRSRRKKVVVRPDSSDSERSSSGCFGWSERLTLVVSSSARRRRKSTASFFGWPTANGTRKERRQTSKGDKQQRRQAGKPKTKRRRDHIASDSNGGAVEDLSQSIRALIRPQGDGDEDDRRESMEDSANVRRAIHALEPYLRSFK